MKLNASKLKHLYRYSLKVEKIPHDTDTESKDTAKQAAANAGDVAPRELGKKKLRRIVQLFIDQHLKTKGPIASDFASLLICLNKLPFATPKEFGVIYSDDRQDFTALRTGGGQATVGRPRNPPGAPSGPLTAGGPSRGPPRYRVTLLDANMLDVTVLLRSLSSVVSSISVGQRMDVLQALNIIIGHDPKADWTKTTLKNKHYEVVNARAVGPNQIGDLRNGLEVLRGVYASVRPTKESLAVNIQIRYCPFYKPGSLVRLITEFRGYRGGNQYTARGLELFLKGVSVQTEYSGTKIKTITSLAMPEMANTNSDLQFHPRVLAGTAANAEEVKFRIKENSERNIREEWITVGDFFRRREFCPWRCSYIRVLTFLYRVSNTRREVQRASHQRWEQKQNLSNPIRAVHYSLWPAT